MRVAFAVLAERRSCRKRAFFFGGVELLSILHVCLSRYVPPRIEDFFSLSDQLRQRPHSQSRSAPSTLVRNNELQQRRLVYPPYSKRLRATAAIRSRYSSRSVTKRGKPTSLRFTGLWLNRTEYQENPKFVYAERRRKGQLIHCLYLNVVKFHALAPRQTACHKSNLPKIS